MTIVIAIIAGALISAGFFWMLFHDLPAIARAARKRRDEERDRD